MAELYLAEQEAPRRTKRRRRAPGCPKNRELRAKVADAEAKVEAFRAEFGPARRRQRHDRAGPATRRHNAQLAAARATQADAIAKAQSLRTMLREGRLDEVPDAAKDESLRRYVEQRVALKAQIALESRTLLPQHPRMKELNGELAGLDDEIRLAANKAVLALEDDAKRGGGRSRQPERRPGQQSKTVATGNVDDVQLRALELDAKTSRDQLKSYLQKYREALAREADNAAPADARIIESATEPRTPTFPKKAPTVLLATLAGFLVSSASSRRRCCWRTPPSFRAARPPRRSPARASADEERRRRSARWRDSRRRSEFPTPFPPPRRSPTGSPTSRGTARR